MSATHYLPLVVEYADEAQQARWIWAVLPDGDRLQVWAPHLIPADDVQHNDGTA